MFTIHDLQRIAVLRGYAVPHLLGGSVEMVVSQIKAAEDKKSPLAIGFAPEVFSMIPIEISLPLIINAAALAKVPVATQLEHGKDFNVIMKAIKLGISSVMFDGSGLPYEENVQKTKEIVKIAHSFGISVEAELGYVGGSALARAIAKPGYLTEPEMVVDFTERTEVDSLAISFGNVHGKYHVEPELNFDLVREIKSKVDTPLVMHGGSGLTEREYRGCIESGISTIHFYTGIAIGVWKHLRNSVGDEEKPVYHELMEYTMDYFYNETVNIIDMSGSGGQVD
jgi:fructose-bisphosphate aldolase class II